MHARRMVAAGPGRSGLEPGAARWMRPGSPALVSPALVSPALVIAAALLTASAARAAGPAPLDDALRSKLEECSDLDSFLAPAAGKGKAVTLARDVACGAGERMVELRRGGQRALVVLGGPRPAGDAAEEAVEPPACSVYLLGKDRRPPLTGKLWPGEQQQVEARVLPPADCTEESCPYAVTLTRRDGTVCSAVRLPGPCDHLASLKRVELFRGSDSLELTCRRSVGGGSREQKHLLSAAGGSLRLLLSVDTGDEELPSAEERRQPGYCAPHPVGWIRVVETGDRPVVRTLSPDPETQEDGKGQGLLQQWAYDPARHRFTPAGAPAREPYDTRSGCRKKR